MEESESDDKILIKSDEKDNYIDDINTNNNLEDELISKDEDIKNNEDKNNLYLIPPKDFGFKNDVYESSNIFSKLFFYWGYKILKLTSKYKIETSHLGKLDKKNDSKFYFKDINYYWENKKYKKIENHGLIKAFLRSNVKKIFIVFILSSFEAFAEYFQVLLIKAYIDYFDSGILFMGLPNIKYVGGLFLLIQFIHIFVNLQNTLIQQKISLKIKYQLNSLIFQKILKISTSSFSQRTSQGKIVNFIQNDSYKISDLIKKCPGIIIYPGKIIAYIYLLFDFFGISFLFGLIAFIIMIIINIIIYKLYNEIEQQFLKAKDNRMKTTTETFENIKIIKLYNWESKFKDKILEKREREIDVGIKGIKVAVTNITLFWFTPILVSIVTIGCYMWLHETFTISTMLVGLTIFTLIKEAIENLPDIITSIIDTMIAMKRIEKFLKEKEINNNIIKNCYNEENAIEINNGYFTWGVKQKNNEKNNNNQEDYEKNNDSDSDEDDKNEDKEEFDENWDYFILDSKRNNSFLNIGFNDNNILNNNNLIGKINNNNEINTSLKNNNDINTHNDDNDKNTDIITEPQNNSNNNYDFPIQIKIPKKAEFDCVLKNINFIVKKNEKVAIIGEVGSGKSSLLQALLNSLIILNPLDCDGIHINGKIGYVSQNNWILNQTIKNNILFFNNFIQEKYDKIVELTELKYDLKTLEAGDNTEIGEKGINLSGGQKARISLARCLYDEPDIYLFDDILSALDADIGKKIMHNCILDYLKNKTCVMVTNALQYIEYFDRIYYFKKGKIEFVGTYKEIKNKEFFIELNNICIKNKILNDGKIIINNKSSNNNDDKEKKDYLKIIKDEDEEIGKVKLNIYFQYFRYLGGSGLMTIIVIIMIFWQITQRGSDYWLAYWSEPENQKNGNKITFFIIYSSLGIAGTIFIFLRIFILSLMNISLARDLHKDMLVGLINSPINLFHETVPRGQILNRLSGDLEDVLFTMYGVGSFLVEILSVLGALILCSIYDTYSLIFIPFLSIIGFILTKFYLNGQRPLTRLEKITKSPVLNMVSETIPGISTIRAFLKDNIFLNNFYNKLNNCYIVNISSKGTYNWYHQQFNFIGLLYSLYIILMSIIFEENYTAQSVGIMFTYSLLLENELGFTFSMFSEMEMSMISMERCYKYTKLNPEKNFVLPEDENLEEKNWPNKGKIVFENLSIKYRPKTEIVLKNLNFEISSGEKIGICGRTGSGKSTICLSIFRLIEPFTGTIYIDDIDIQKVGLDLLRKNLTYIPQEPILMEGSLKFNIDPFNLYENKTIVQILKDIGFEYTEDDDKILDRHIEVNGNNISIGEKQLVCIARAILKKTKILIMDEATANIDIKTEEKIQKIINSNFNDCTIITIAHRIKTILNYDKILVLEKGKILEFDSPKNLLENKDSHFYKLYEKSSL